MGRKRTVPLSVLYDPRRNRGTAFTRKERRKYGIEGILPDAVDSMDTQILRVTDQLDALEHPIQKYIYLSGLLDVNERLFYRAVGTFNLFRVCNHWIADLLDAAGVPTAPVLATWPQGLLWDLTTRAGAVRLQPAVQ